jgi:hypothetical protein
MNLSIYVPSTILALKMARAFGVRSAKAAVDIIARPALYFGRGREEGINGR